MADQDIQSRDYAVALDSNDPLHHIRAEFCIPSKADIRATSLPELGKKAASGPGPWTKLIFFRVS